MKKAVCFALLSLLAAGGIASAVEFERVPLTDKFLAEGAFYGDFNNDGKTDITYGPYIFYGPDFQTKTAIREVGDYKPEGYSDQFLAFADDVNGDGWLDVIQVPWPGEKGYWYENPGEKGGEWTQHFISEEIGNESQVFVDVDGDGHRDLVFCKIGYVGFASYDPKNPNEPWKWTAVSKQDNKYQRYYHGIGAGDVNTDGHVDIIESQAWHENPNDPNHEGPWTEHPFPFAARGGSTMLVYDVDGDGLNDVVTADSAHLFGIQWWKASKAADGTMSWEKQEIIPAEPKEGDFAFSQAHAFDLGDINGDGLTDFVTGKRFWAHGPSGDVFPNAPAVLYWFELQRGADGSAKFIPHLIDDNSGVGTQITVGDVNGDGCLDVLSGNKKGCTVFLQK